MAQIAPLGWYRGFDADGNPLAGGKLYTYEAGTSTPKTTYTDKAGTIANANPVVLDADGYADVWLDTGGYKFRLENSSGVLQREKDNIDGGASTGFASQVVSRSSSFSLSLNDRNFVNVCTAALTVSLLPAATAGDGFTAVIVNLSAGNVTIDPDGSETINNASSLVIGPSNSATITCDGSEWYAFGYTQTEFSDNVFRVVGSADVTKKVAFEVDGITTATTRTLTVQNKSGILPVIEVSALSVPATSAGPSSLVLAEDTDSGVNTATIIAPTTLGSDVVLTLPNNSGPLSIMRNQQVFTAGGTFTPASGVSKVYVECFGAGGGGGGSSTTIIAGGGGSGAYSAGFVSVTEGVGCTVAVGTGGAGGTTAGGNGAAGSAATTFNSGATTLSAGAGSGGTGGTANGAFAGGAGGAVSGGTINITGQRGSGGVSVGGVAIRRGGAGGSCPKGGGGSLGPQSDPAYANEAGTAGINPGGGGGGASGTAQAGGAGADGMVVVWYP